MLKLLPLLLLLMLSLAVHGQVIRGTTVDGFKYRVTTGVIIDKYTGPGGNVIIPSSINVSGTDLTVWVIDYGAFNFCTRLTSVTIPDSVIKIDDQAFYGCSSLISVTIPDSVQSIGFKAFDYCTSLRSVVFRGNAPWMGGGRF